MKSQFRYAFELQQDNIELALYEATQLLNCQLSKLFDGVYTTKSELNEALFFRLAYTTKIHRVIKSTKSEDTAEILKLPHESFKVAFVKDEKRELCQDEKHTFFDLIHSATNDAKVSMKNPKHTYTIILSEDSLICEQVFQNDKEFYNRAPNKRPCFHPSSMSPKVAKAMINIAGPNAKVIHDPFCGTGGLLIESLHNNVGCYGGDIDDDMLHASRENIKHTISSYPNIPTKMAEVVKESALETTRKSDAIISDVPYGKNTKSVGNIDTLYTAFLEHAKKEKLSTQIIFCIPDKSNLIRLAEKHGWTVQKNITEYVHKSLTRYIIHLTLK